MPMLSLTDDARLQTAQQPGTRSRSPLPPQLARHIENMMMRSQKLGQTASQPDYFLPSMQESIRAMPNLVCRSSLFAPIARGSRTIHSGTVLVSRVDVVIKFWGEQLDEADADILMQLLHEARHIALGCLVTTKRANLLRKLGRDNGKSQYSWLHRRMMALAAAKLNIDAKKKDGSLKYHIGGANAFHILQNFTYDEKSKSYLYSLDPRWAKMYSNNEYCLIDWNIRQNISRGQDMAKALQRLIATSSDRIQKYSLDWLKDKMQYTGRMCDFRTALGRAMRELERPGLALIAAGRLEISQKGKEQAAWHRL